MSNDNLTFEDSPIPGHREPAAFSLSHKKLAMWLFIASDSITFAAILFAYGFLRNGSADWPTPFQKSSVITAYAMTFLLVSSSLMMVLAVRAAHTQRSKALAWSGLAMSGGIGFVILHIREWLRLIAAGMGMFHNSWGLELFGAAFFSITGLHLAHVAVGTIAIAVVALGFQRGRYDAVDLEVWGLYWHFVDVVWMFIFPFVYLLNVRR